MTPKQRKEVTAQLRAEEKLKPTLEAKVTNLTSQLQEAKIALKRCRINIEMLEAALAE